MAAENSEDSSPKRYRNPAHPGRIREWMRTNWHLEKCPICATDKFTPSTGIYEIAHYNPFVGPTVSFVPAFTVTCVTCGYVVWINAINADVFRVGEDPVPNRDEPES
jgi:hypothetical protein